VPVDAMSTSASPSPSETRPLPLDGTDWSMPPKNDGVEPKRPVQRLTWNGSHARPSTAIRPSWPNAIAGSLSPVEFAFGDVGMPPSHVAINGVLENADEAPAFGEPAAAWAAKTSATAAAATVQLALMGLPLPSESSTD